ncbi:hypothetical protein WJX74_010239 [Apatococcus lobatus]|uniref:DDE Tnp4 domain-containing protein n=1 Tax=Apatococcus lobatus TaxID=904363 RepID=A0AAW1QH93_9CHLO
MLSDRLQRLLRFLLVLIAVFLALQSVDRPALRSGSKRSFQDLEDEDHLVNSDGTPMSSLVRTAAGRRILGLMPLKKRRQYHSIYYVKPRSKVWWSQLVTFKMEEVEYFKCFRVTRATFEYIYRQIGPHIAVQPIVQREIVEADRRLAIFIWHMAQGPVSTNNTAHHYAEYQVIKGFEGADGSGRHMPNVVGAIDCTHVKIIKPTKVQAKPYRDREHNYSLVLQAVVDHRMKFIDVYLGWPGSVHDSWIFSYSPLAERMHNDDFLPGLLAEVDGQLVKPYIIGDPGYALSPQVMIPYPGSQLPVVKDKFNYYHSSTRMCVERAFGRLKGRWKFLEGPIRMRKPTRIMDFILACCILHNICVDRQEAYQFYEESEDSVIKRMMLAQPDEEVELSLYEEGAKAVRDHLAQFLVSVN